MHDMIEYLHAIKSEIEMTTVRSTKTPMLRN